MLLHRRKGFTLIELLIVIAIILILISIALPNFLEAQIRAKVARAESDMKTIQTALEAYRIDWPQYPPSYNVFLHSWYPGWLSRLLPLTTPHQYITAIPVDPFFTPHAGLTEAERDIFEVYSYAEDYFGNYPYPPNDRLGLVNPWGNDVTYHLTGLGPDGELNFEQAAEDIASGLWDPDDHLGWLMKQYAPTNGTKSEGDILKWGGGSSGGCRPDADKHSRNDTPPCP